MDDALWTAIVGFTREEIGRPWLGKEPSLTPSTHVFEDLRIDGDDAIEFVDRFFEKFNVKGDFPYARYFGGEGTAGPALLFIPFLVFAPFRALFRLERASNANPEYRSLTLGMLYEAARIGHWDAKAIEAAQWPQP
ncbi:DUF1493 family protein [Caballeronia sp. J97]|uniref:DUF1493 family protein n=1 Tax=Caballeronia sp. J97 TaxID=2805429 RepID=UPI002AAF9B81|nr:DUF1493 family protein [Caballeronia sp. J97]